MAVARKSGISTTGGWFQRRTPRSFIANVQTGTESNRRPASDVPSTQPSARSSWQPSLQEPQRGTKMVSPKNVRNSNNPGNNISVPNPNRRSRSSKGESPVINKNKNSRLPIMPSNESGPMWLLRLQILNRHSSLLAFLMVATMLVVYGWTVYSQQLWSQSSKRLQSLQRQERQLMATDAALKEQMAKEAQKAPNGLVSPTPGNMIFLPPSAPGSPNQVPSTLGQKTEAEQQTLTPVGY
ncbi:MAG: hypothetical protein KME60_13920 [Cyanomargarita calcarea GSE-NOS-MK-12-04C]|uniref:Cell division protein FtsL n=1 Tax=Cyanomargarita calcarea GSE-NOS-MK-12-04C TaxID=2839659 RepID=A0A951QLK7_9CYAN|nr:hypothetical protein [Cyanomargarita calcarea GSE-NOS-MK-12-04C]